MRPDHDLWAISTLFTCLITAKIERLILISTVDVYAKPLEVDELTRDAAVSAEPYGRNRAALEVMCKKHFNTQILRLPGLFGPGLKKNAFYDLMTAHMASVPENARYQWYPVWRVGAAVRAMIEGDERIVHLTSEPMAMAELRDSVFPGAQLMPPDDAAANYDVRSIFKDCYIDKKRVIAEMQKYLAVAESANA